MASAHHSAASPRLYADMSRVLAHLFQCYVVYDETLYGGKGIPNRRNKETSNTWTLMHSSCKTMHRQKFKVGCGHPPNLNCLTGRYLDRLVI